MNFSPNENLFKEIIEIGSRFGNITFTDLIGDLCVDPNKLIEIYNTYFNNNENWEQINFNLNKKIICDLTKICSSTTDSQIKNTIDNICQKILNKTNYLEKDKVVDKTNDLIDILQLAMENSLEGVCSNCINKLGEEYSFQISILDNKSISIKVSDLKDSEIIKIKKFISAFDGIIPIVIELIPTEECNCQSLLNFANDCGRYVNKLNLAEMGNQITDEIIIELSKNCNNLCHLVIKSFKITDATCLSNLSTLVTLTLFACLYLKKLPELSILKNLTTLNLSYCRSLKELPGLSALTNLTILCLSDCKIIKLDLSTLKKLITFNVSGCFMLEELIIRGLPNLKTLILCNSLKELSLSALPSLETPLDFTYLSSLQKLSLSALPNFKILDLSSFTSCTRLKELYLSDLPNLETVKLSCCKSLSKLSLSSITFLNKIINSFEKNYLNFLSQLNTLTIAEKEIKDILADPIVKIYIALMEESKISLPMEFDSSDEKDMHFLRICKILSELKEIVLKNSFLSKNSFDQFVKIFKEFDPQQYQKHVLWFGNIIAEFIDHPAASADEEAILTLQSIAKLTDPFVMKQATSALFYLYQKRNELKLHSWKSSAEKTPSNLAIIKVAMAANGMGKEEISRVIELLKPEFFRSSEVITPINEFLLLVYKSTISLDQKQRLIQMILETPNIKGHKSKEKQRLLELNRNQQAIKVAAARDILFFGAEQKLQEVSTSEKLISNWTNIFQDRFGIVGGEKELQRFSEIFREKARYPDGLVTYAARLQILPQKEIFTKLLSQFTLGVLNGQYPELRYQFDNNPHLKTIFALRPELLTKWKDSIKLSASDILGSNKIITDPIVRNKEIKKNIKEKLSAALEHRHFGEDQATIFPILSAFKEWDSPEAIAQAKAQLEKLFTKELTDLKSINIPKDKKLIQEKITQIEIQKNCFKLLDPTLDEKQLVELLDKIQRVLPKNCEFKTHDIDGIIKQINAEIMPHDKWIVKDSDHWEDMLLMGTEVENSCQRINGVPHYNKCLISYIIDGKNKPMVVIDAKGKIIARSIMRILWDEKLNQPVLFMEKIYTKYLDPALRVLIMEGCKHKAKELGLTLVASLKDYPKLNENKAYENPLESYVGPAPAEYVDALGGIQDSRYTITNSRILYSPTADKPWATEHNFKKPELRSGWRY